MNRAVSLLFRSWILTLAAWILARGQVINPTPTNPGPYFGPAEISFIQAQQDGKVVIAGNFGLFTGLEEKRLVRLNVDGSFDETFQIPALPPGPYNQGIVALCALPNDKLLLGLSDTNGIVRLNADGTLDSTFQVEPIQNQGSYYVSVYGIAPQSEGKTIINGYFNQVGTNGVPGIARLNSDGSFDPTFHPSFTMGTNLGVVSTVLVQPGGKIVVLGDFDAVDGEAYRGLARLNQDGSVDPTFINNTNLTLYFGIFDVQDDGKILVGSSLGLMRLTADGAIDYRFNPGLGISGTNRYLISARSQKGGDLFIFGNFDKYDDQRRRSCARLNEDGSLDASFDPQLTKTDWARYPEIIVRAVETLADGSFIIAGSFTDVQGKSITGLARFKPDGSVDESFNPFRPACREDSMTLDGFYQFRVIGEKSRPYVVEGSSDLKTWQPLRNVMIGDFPFYFIDLRQTSGQGYYRISSL